VTGQHTVVATVTINQPAYDVTHPRERLYEFGFEVLGDVGGWVSSPANTGLAGTSVGIHSGTLGGLGLVKNVGEAGTKTATFTRLFTGLIVGRSYTFTVWVKQYEDAARRSDTVRVGVAGIGNGATVVPGPTWAQATFTFTATATSHSLVITATEASTTATQSRFYLDDMEVWQEAWSEHFPAEPSHVEPFDVVETDMTLDDSWSPYGQAQLLVGRPPEQVLEFLDPRIIPTPRVELTLSDGTVSRDFDLVLRSRTINHATAQVSVTAETDEALLIDLVRVATTVDTTARAYQASLRALINAEVLAPIDAVLAADAGADANLTVYADQTNLVPNPSGEVNTAGWTATACTVSRVAVGGLLPPGGAYVIRTSAPAGSAPYMQTANLAVRPGATYVLRARGRATVAGTGTPNPSHGAVLVYPATGALIVSTNAVDNASSAWQDLAATFTVPAGVTEVFLRVVMGYPTGAVYDWDMFKLSESTGGLDDGTYFDGDTPDTSTYRYDWTGTAHASTSTRTNMSGVDRDPAMFDWLPGQSLWDFVQPLVQAGGLRLFSDEARVWHLVDPVTYAVPGLTTINAGEHATAATDTISRYGDWFDSVVIRYRWTDAAGVVQIRYDAAGSPSSKTLTIDESTPFPGVGAAAALLARSTARGRVFDLAAVSDYAVTPSQVLASKMPSTPRQVGTTSAVRWAIPADEMTVRSRGLTDSPDDLSWLALLAGESWLDSPVGESWLEEIA